jgi:hypothetical protein
VTRLTVCGVGLPVHWEIWEEKRKVPSLSFKGLSKSVLAKISPWLLPALFASRFRELA